MDSDDASAMYVIEQPGSTLTTSHMVNMGLNERTVDTMDSAWKEIIQRAERDITTGKKETGLNSYDNGKNKEKKRKLPFASLFPLVRELQYYDRKTLLADFLSAITVSFVLIPQAIAFSGLAGVKPIRGLLSSVVPLLIYTLLGASKQLSIGIKY